MGIAMFAASAFVNPIDQIASFFMPRRARNLKTSKPLVQNVATPVNAACRVKSQATVRVLTTRPLRVLRVIDRDTSGAGRMVISGRMADVCAELDRLAAIEAANS